MEKKVTPAEKREARFRAWSAAEGIQFESPEAEATYKKAIERFKDVALLEKIPDRVPVLALGTFVETSLHGVTPYEAMYDVDKMIDAHVKFLQDYRPDYGGMAPLIGWGKVFEILGYKQYRWPGYNLPKDSVYQYVEGEYMMADEYDALIDDPTDFWLRTYMPRAFGALEPLKMISPFTDMWEMVLVTVQMIPFGIPPVQGALKALIDAGNEAMAWIEKVGAFDMKQKAMGFPGIVWRRNKSALRYGSRYFKGHTRHNARFVQATGQSREGRGETHADLHQAGRPRCGGIRYSNLLYTPP